MFSTRHVHAAGLVRWTRAVGRRRFGLIIGGVATALAVVLVVPVPTAYGAAPSNDNFAAATVMTSLPFTDTVATIAQATTESGEPVGWNIGQNTVWYRFTPSSRAVVRAQVQGMGYYVLNAYREDGSGISGLTLLTGYIAAPIVFDAQPGSTYYIQAGNFGPVPVQWWETFTFGLTIVPPPTNDNFVDATPITTLPFRDSADMTGATTEPGEPSALCGGNFPRTVWYSFTPTASGTYSASNFADRILGSVNVFTGTTLESLTQVACGANGGSGAFHADAGTTYYLQAGTWYSSGSLGTQLEVMPPPGVGMLWGPIPTTRFDVIGFQGLCNDPMGVDSWTWDFGDGETATGQYPQHQYADDGDYNVTVTVTTSDGRTNSATEVVPIRTPDTTPPEIWFNDMSLVATSPGGAPVEFTVTATDENPPEPVVRCTPPSGSVFPIGVTTVTCSATDDAGNTATTAFDVTVMRPQDEYLHGSGNPPTLTLDMFMPTSSSAKYSDSGGVRFAGGNPWVQVGTWSDPSTVMHGWTYKFNLWAGLKNSDDQGTAFDLRADVYVNGTLAGTCMTRAVAGLTRNPSLAQFVTLRFGTIGTGKSAFLEPGDSISIVLLTRIGTNPDGTKYPGHANATGLRVYFDSADRPTHLKGSGWATS